MAWVLDSKNLWPLGVTPVWPSVTEPKKRILASIYLISPKS